MSRASKRAAAATRVASLAPEERTVTVELSDLTFGGEAMGRADGRVVFVPFGLPGEQVTVEVTEDHGDYRRGRIIEIVRPSAERVQPPCEYFGECGGCSLQHAAYGSQLDFKRKIVVEQIRRIGRFEQAEMLVLPTIGMINPWAYRNHIRFSVGRRFGELCFTERGTRRLMRIEHCLIAQPAIDNVAVALQGRLVGFSGHQVAIRVGANTGDLLINPEIPDVTEIPSGQNSLAEELFDRRFRIASPAFFQVNTVREARAIPDGLATSPWPLSARGLSMAEIMALVVHDRLSSASGGLLVDAYCGVGTFAILLARAVAQVIGIEEATAAIKEAKRNAADLTNVEFIAGKTEDVLPKLSQRPDAVVLDPARVGCHPAVLNALADLEVPRVVYVSCDPSTLARDLAILVQHGFRLENIQPLDMFPQTFHVEAVAALGR